MDLLPWRYLWESLPAPEERAYSARYIQGIHEVVKPENIFSEIPDSLDKEIFERLAGSGQVTIERIVSQGHTSPATGWYDENTSEWVIVLRGEALLSFDDQTSVHLREGDYLNLPAHRKHRVDWTAPDRETVWLAVHYPV